MDARPLGRTGLRLSAIGFGAWGIGGDAYGPADDAESIRAVHRALDLGCSFFDTADVYGEGRSEALLGKALRDLKPAPVVATKGGWVAGCGWGRQDFSYPALKQACERSLARLRREAIDLYQLHGPPAELLRSGELFESLWRLRAEGLIRYAGVSVPTPKEGFAALKGGVDAIQVAYHMLSHTAEVGQLLARCRVAGVGVIAREPLANGFLGGRYGPDARFGPKDLRAEWPAAERARRAGLAARLAFLVRPDRTLAQSALKFVLANEDVGVAIPGIKTVAQAEENLRTPLAPDLTLSELEAIFETTAGCGE